MSVLIDTSVWVAYFRSGDNSEKLDFLIDENLIVINDLVLAELVPSLKVRNQRKIINLLYNISNYSAKKVKRSKKRLDRVFWGKAKMHLCPSVLSILA